MAATPLLASLIALLLFYQITNNCLILYGDDVIKGTELVLTFVVHRHGDRTPEEATMRWALDMDELLPLIQPWGYGQLTNVGRKKGYEIGKFLRKRYYSLLSPVYNQSEIYIRCTDITRTKMTALTAMAGAYPPVGVAWSSDINWVPVPYTTVPFDSDFIEASSNCPKLIKAYQKLSYSREYNFKHNYTEVIKILSDKYRQNISYPGQISEIHDIFESMISLGMDIKPELTAVKHDLHNAASQAMDIIYGNEQYIALQSGVFLNEFFESATAAISGNDTERVRIYSAQDINVYAFEAVTKVTRQGVPKYGAIYALELRRVEETGRFVVLPVYVASPGDEEKYLEVQGCDGLLCDYNKFHFITSKYILTENEWRKKCGLPIKFEL